MEEYNQNKTIEDTQIFFYRVPIAAKAISVSRGKMYDMIRKNMVPTYKLGSVTLIKASELFQLVESFKTEESNEKGGI